MERLLNLFLSFLSWVRGLVGLVLPVFAEAADFRSWPRWVKALVHVLVLASLLYGLHLLTPYLQPLLKTKANNFVQQYYLVLVGVLVYLLTWVGYFIWQLLTRTDAAEFPDIEQAWAEAVRRLAQAGYRLADYPLFLVIGKPASDVDGLFLASKLKIDVRAPTGAESPVRVFAGRDAIYVTCGGASAWSRFADALADPDAGGLPGFAGGDPADPGKTITPGQALGNVDPRLQDEFYALLRLQSERPLAPDEEERLKEVGDLIARAKGPTRRAVGLSAADQALGPKRLAYLCRLIARDRRPLCPVNGALVLVPWEALGSDETCSAAVPVLAADVAAARQAFAQRYPQYVMVCDLEHGFGFDEFRRGFPKEMLRQRIGQRLPVVPDRDPAALAEVFDRAADWIRLNVLASWVVRFLRLEWPPEVRKSGLFVPTYNRKLFTFLHEVYERGPRLGRLLARGLPPDPTAAATGDALDAYPLIGGCYLAATGRDERDQAFAAGVFERLAQSQDSVSWTAAAVAENRAYRRLATALYVAALALAVPAAMAGYYIVYGPR
jgi:hypothetical protein